MGCKGVVKMGGIFDDIFDDDDFEIASEEEIDESFEEVPTSPDDWGTGGGATWDTGQKQDIWNADEPWSCDDDDGCDGCGDCDPKQQGFDVDGFFN